MAKIKKVHLDGQRFRLTKDNGGINQFEESGALHPTKRTKKYPYGRQPKSSKWGDVWVGYSVFCGAWRTTMFGADTWWVTSPVTEILEFSKDKKFVRFKTMNSIYTAEVIM